MNNLPDVNAVAQEMIERPSREPAAAAEMGNPKNLWYSTYNMTWFESFARRKPGVTEQAATTDLTHAYEVSYKKQVAAQPRTTPAMISSAVAPAKVEIAVAQSTMAAQTLAMRKLP